MSSAETTAEPEVRDEQREAFLERARAELGEALVDTHLQPGADLWLRVRREDWARAGEILRDRLDFDYFCFLSAIDWMPSPFGRGEDDPTEPTPERSTAIVQGHAGGETRFQLLARVTSTRQHLGVILKCDVPDGDLTMPSWVRVYAGANWHERETWEMFGIVFQGHPDLRHLYLPGDFEGYPLRKDFPLLARMVKPWPGIVDVEPMPAGEDAEETEAEA